MNEISFPDPHRNGIEITMKGWVDQSEDGTWWAHVSEHNPGYATSWPSTSHRTRKKAEKEVRDKIRQRLKQAEITRQKLSEPVQFVDLTGIR